MNTRLENEIIKFKKWAENYSYTNQSRASLHQFDTHFTSEWECDYNHWQALYTAFNHCIESNPPSLLNEHHIKNIIYIIARDNEMENLIATLATHTNWFKKVLPHVLDCEEPEAKWQFALALGGLILPFETSENALLKLVTDKNEYVSRIALQSLGKIGSSKTESLCIKAWHTNHEYQRIMALWVLKEIHSNQLEKYLFLAEKDGRPHLINNAQNIRQQ